ncbi:autophagy-related protein 18f, partial [Phtheirospermum japonicum]
VSWAGFDSIELERGITRQVLLLGFSYGFQVWDVEVADNVHNLVSRHDGPVSFMQMLPKPLASIHSGDKFAESRPLLIICGIPSNGSIKLSNGSVNGSYEPTAVWVYSLKSQSYVHLLRFRSTVHLVRCSSRVVAVLQSAQIHCLNAATLEREYTILINPVTTGSYGFSPRWMAYSGSPVAISNSRCVSPQHLTPSSSFPGHASNGSLVAHYARESSKHLAAGIVTLGDMGYKKLTRYYSELLPEGGNNGQTGTVRVKMHSVANGHSNFQVIVRDIVDKTVIAQFRAHKSPIQSLCFDPSGTLLVTASIQGHNINVFRIMPGSSSEGPSGPPYVHLYRLQRGFTNAVIQDISFSNDSRWIMISSSRGTSHLFAISPSGGSGPPVTLSAVSRIRSGSSNGWRNTVSGAAAAATGRLSSLSGAIASIFHDGNSNPRGDSSSLKKNYYLLVFSPSGCVMQYALRFLSALDDVAAGVSYNHESDLDYDARLMVEALQKWNICQKQKQNRKEEGDNVDAYGVNLNLDTNKIYPENLKFSNNLYPDVLGTTANEKIVNEEKHHHMYISEAELRMHQNQNPLWARRQIYFQLMLADGSNVNEEGTCGGEIEIERVLTRMLEGRSKDLVPVFDYLQSPKFQQGRCVYVRIDYSLRILF